jgi:DNA-binding NarL/FixJ family response regulator
MLFLCIKLPALKPQKNILVVDDSAVWIKRLTHILKELKNVGDIAYAASYQEAIEKIQVSKPDIVLLDISLPDRNGIDLIKIFREAFPEIVLVMVTNYADEFYRNLSKKLGADHFIDKSNEFEQIAAIIEKQPGHVIK